MISIVIYLLLTLLYIFHNYVSRGFGVVLFVSGVVLFVSGVVLFVSGVVLFVSGVVLLSCSCLG